MFRWMFFCFIVGKRMDVPEEEHQKRNEKRKKRKQEEEPGRGRRGLRREEEEEEEEEIRRGLSNKRYVSSCIIEDASLTFTDYSFNVYRWMKDAGRKMRKMTTEKENLNRNLRVKKDEYETKCTSTIEPV